MSQITPEENIEDSLKKIILEEIYESSEFNSAEGGPYDPKKGEDGGFRCGRKYTNFNIASVFVEYFRFTETCGPNKGRQCPLCKILHPTENDDHIGDPCSSENGGNKNILFNTLNSIKQF